MPGEPRLNVYVLDSDLSPRLRERLQAQVQSAIRGLPSWMFSLLARRLDELGASGLPLVVEPVATPSEIPPLGLGEIDGRPAARLRPRVSTGSIDWTQDARFLAAKAVAYLAAPHGDPGFWCRWSEAVALDRLRDKASTGSPAWRVETDVGLLVEMVAAFALRGTHSNWAELPAVHAFLEDWRDTDG